MFAYPAHGVAGQVRFVENLHKGAAGRALYDLDPVEHRSRGAIPFRQHQHVVF